MKRHEDGRLSFSTTEYWAFGEMPTEFPPDANYDVPEHLHKIAQSCRLGVELGGDNGMADAAVTRLGCIRWLANRALEQLPPPDEVVAIEKMLGLGDSPFRTPEETAQ